MFLNSKYRKPFRPPSRGFHPRRSRNRSFGPLLRRIRPTFSLVRYALGVYVGGGFHLGSTVRRWSPNLSFALLGRRGGRFFFDPVRSTFLLRRATLFISKVVAKRGNLLLLAGADSTLSTLRPFLKSLRLPLLKGRYRAGTLTNYKVSGLPRLPSAVLLLDRWRTAYSVREAALLRLPLIGFVDSDMDPTQLPYPIPANNDTPDGVVFLLRLLLQSHLSGRLGELKRIQYRRRVRSLRFKAALKRRGVGSRFRPRYSPTPSRGKGWGRAYKGSPPNRGRGASFFS